MRWPLTLWKNGKTGFLSNSETKVKGHEIGEQKCVVAKARITINRAFAKKPIAGYLGRSGW